DDSNDVFFLRRALTRAGLPPPVHVAANGQDALDYLNGTGKYSDRETYPLPQCIFLDLKLPLVHGFQVLDHIRRQPGLRDVPVFILSSSSEPADRRRAAELGVHAYLLKPPEPDSLTE